MQAINQIDFTCPNCKRERNVRYVSKRAVTHEGVTVEREVGFSIVYMDFNQWLAKATTRTSAYQRRVINYIRNHPNASLAEARGHKAKKL